MRARAIALFALATSLAVPSIASADPTPAEAELSTARALFEEGLAREDARDWTGALARFRRVSEIRVTPQVTYNIALCLDRIGKIASADKEYARVEKETTSSEAAVRELARLSTARRKEIRDAIPQITVDAPKDLAVTVDGQSAQIQTPIEIDPGVHEIASRRGTATAKKRFTVAVKERTTVVAPAPEEPPPPPPPSRTIPTGAWITGGVTVAAFGVAIAAVIVRSSAISDLDAVCGPNRDQCPDDKRPVADRVTTATTIANVGAVVGVASAVATGALIYVAFTSKPSSSAGLYLAPRGAGLDLGARF